MSKRIKRVFMTGAALAALAVGGAAFAGAQQPGTATPPVKQSAPSAEQVGGKDGDNVQAGDQSTPDSLAGEVEKAGSEGPEQPGSEAPEPAGSEGAEQAGSEAETAPGDDGPGGHADEAEGNPNADHQFQGTE